MHVTRKINKNPCLISGIRHPEELSFCKPLEPNHLKYNLKDLPVKKKVENQKNGHWNVPADTNTFIPASQSPRGSTGSLDQSSPFMCAPVTPNNRNHSTPISSPISVGVPFARVGRRDLIIETPKCRFDSS